MQLIGEKRLVVRESDIEGSGLFTTYDIRKGEVICVLQGERIHYSELKRRYAQGSERICDPVQISEQIYLDLDKPYVHINHACNPNTALIREATLLALRRIKRGEELTYDYSITEWTYERFGKFKEWEMNCNCGAENCRSVIKPFDSLSQKIKQHYYKIGALQDFILRKIGKNI